MATRCSYTGWVIRVVTIVLALAALAASGPLRMLHVHGYEEHDHPDHHHGPAAHSHTAARPLHQDVRTGDAGAIRLESCDPGAHVVPVAFTCVPPLRPHVPVVEPTVVAQIRLPPVAPTSFPVSDTRAHSPPRLTDAPLRAPPLVHLA